MSGQESSSSSSGMKSGAKKLFDKGWAMSGKYIGEPANKLVGKWGMEGFWPTTTDKELDKAARILRVFTLDGGVPATADNIPDPSAAKKQQKVVKRIPQKVIAQAKGIAIFTVFRSGLHVSAASGSGLVLSRLPDGSWSAPSGILIHTIGVGFMVGIDIYDVVLILNTDEAVNQFKHARVKLGGEVSVAAGPVGGGGMMDVSKAASWSYTKSKGFYAGVQLDGSIIGERSDENSRFYGQPVKAEQILAGQVPRPSLGEGLYQTLAAAQGLQTQTNYIPQGMGPSEEYQSVNADGHQDSKGTQAPNLPPRDYGEQVPGEAPPTYEKATHQGS